MGVKVNCFCAVNGAGLEESVAVTVKVKLAGCPVAIVGVPVISPVAVFKLNPLPSEAGDQVMAPTPPVAVRI